MRQIAVNERRSDVNSEGHLELSYTDQHCANIGPGWRAGLWYDRAASVCISDNFSTI